MYVKVLIFLLYSFFEMIPFCKETPKCNKADEDATARRPGIELLYYEF